MRVTAVAKFYSMPKSTVSTIVRRLRAQNSNSVIEKRGRKPKLNARSLRILRKYILHGRFLPLYAITAQINEYTDFNVSVYTVRRYVHKLEFESFVAVPKPFLSAKNIVARVSWANTLASWSKMQWDRAVYTDEASFAVRPLKKHIRV